MAKLVQLSDDGGSVFDTLPGSSGELTEEREELSDTIFGQTFNSNEVGLINWSVSANAFYKGFAGYQAKVLQQGATTAFTTESFTVVSGKTFTIDDDTKEIWDRSVTLTFFDNAVPVVAADIESVNYLFGTVTFATGFSVTEPITATGSYFPTIAIAGASSYTLTQTADTKQTTDFVTAQANGGFHTFEPGLRSVSVELSGFYDLTNAFLAALKAGTETIIEINPDGLGENAGSVARGFFKPITHGQSGDVGALEEETVEFRLTVPNIDDLLIPFDWQHAGTSTIDTAIKIAITAWLNEDVIDVQYLEDGVAGVKGQCVVTDISLEGALDGMNTFSIDVQGSGVETVV